MSGIHSSGKPRPLVIHQSIKMRFPNCVIKMNFKRCGGNSNNFESEMHCTATCLKAMFNI